MHKAFRIPVIDVGRGEAVLLRAMPNQGFPDQGWSHVSDWDIDGQIAIILWMDEIMHHFETTHCLLVFTGESSFQGF